MTPILSRAFVATCACFTRRVVTGRAVSCGGRAGLSAFNRFNATLNTNRD